MSKEKKIICLLTGIILGMILSVGYFSLTADAQSRNVKTAARRLIKRYPETHILPSVGLGIFIQESGGGHNNGRFYGIVSCSRYPRTWDVEESTDQFLNLMERYRNVDDRETWLSQLYALQSHGYYGGSSVYYIGCVSRIIERNGFTEYDEKAKRYEKRQRARKKALRKKRRDDRRKQIQSRQFILAYDPNLLPWQARTHKGAIKGGTIRIESEIFPEYAWLDVVDTEKGDDQVIYIGNLSQVMLHPVVGLAEVIEEAVG